MLKNNTLTIILLIKKQKNNCKKWKSITLRVYKLSEKLIIKSSVKK